MANIVPTSNIGGMQQVKHISNHLLTPFSGCHGQPGLVQHGSDEELVEPDFQLFTDIAIVILLAD